MLTLLPASAIPGLEVMHMHTGEWMQVERGVRCPLGCICQCEFECLLTNLDQLTPGRDVIAIAGAAMGWLTNGQYRPLIHRVVRFQLGHLQSLKKSSLFLCSPSRLRAYAALRESLQRPPLLDAVLHGLSK